MNGSIRLVLLFLFSIFSLFSNLAAASPVKLSNSGLCHPPQSRWYGRIKNYQPFDSLSACVQAGGKLPGGVSGETQNASSGQSLASAQGYKRSAFGAGWDDADGDCQNSRAEALIATSTTKVRFATDRHCRVVSGRWISPFSNQVIQNASDIDIDHLVPLAWSWNRGAGQWSREKRRKFANDLINLWPVEAALNRSKGAKGPDQWLPPAGQCGYVARFVRIVKQYQLKPKAAEGEWMRAFLKRCRS